MQHCRSTRENKLKPHPFLLPHRQGDEFWDDCETSDLDFLGLPIHASLEGEALERCGPLSLVRLYVDGLDVGGKSRKAPTLNSINIKNKTSTLKKHKTRLQHQEQVHTGGKKGVCLSVDTCAQSKTIIRSKNYHGPLRYRSMQMWMRGKVLHTRYMACHCVVIRCTPTRDSS